MDHCKIESGIQLFSRLNHRPNLENLNRALFSEGGPIQSQIVQITGESSSGKTLLAIDLLARCLLPHQFNGINLPGKNASAIIINTDHHFHLFTLVGVMESLLKRYLPSGVDYTFLDSIISNCLKNLTVLNCYDSQQLQMTFLNLEKILMEKINIGLVVVDSLLSYYWADRNHLGVISFISYYLQILGKLEAAVKDSKVVVIFTTPNIDTCGDKNKNKDIYRIFLKKLNETFEASVSAPLNSNKVLQFKIESSGAIEFLV